MPICISNTILPPYDLTVICCTASTLACSCSPISSSDGCPELTPSSPPSTGVPLREAIKSPAAFPSLSTGGGKLQLRRYACPPVNSPVGIEASGVVVDQAYRGAFLYLILVADDVADELVDGAKASKLLRSFAIVRAYELGQDDKMKQKRRELTHGSEVKIAP